MRCGVVCVRCGVVCVMWCGEMWYVQVMGCGLVVDDSEVIGWVHI